MERLIVAYPKLMDLAGDVVMSMQDFIGASQIADRLRKTIPEWLEPPKEGEEPRAKPSPSIDDQVKMEKLKVQQMSLEVKRANLEVAKMKFMTELQGAKGEIRKEVLDVLKEVMGGASLTAMGSGGEYGGNPDVAPKK